MTISTATFIEMIGYLGSTLVVISMLMSSVIKLRVVNTVGSVIFAAYAFIIHSYPTAMMNIFLVLINLYNLRKLMKKEQSFDLIDGKADDGMLQYMLQYYRMDIAKYFPGFTDHMDAQDVAYVVYCNGNPAGVMLGREEEAGTVRIKLDYSVPTYRDCSVGKYLYEKLPEKGVRKLVYGEQDSEMHAEYLRKMGFVKEQDVYCKILEKR